MANVDNLNIIAGYIVGISLIITMIAIIWTTFDDESKPKTQTKS